MSTATRNRTARPPGQVRGQAENLLGAATAQTATPTVALELIDAAAEGTNPRQGEPAGEEFEGLVASVRAHGILQPILVRPAADGRFELVAGGRRLAAARTAELGEIPVHVRADGEGAIAALVENVQRADLTPLEEADAIARLRDALSDEDRAAAPTKTLAEALGKSRDWVQKRLQLLDLPDVARTAIREGQVGLHGAPVLARVAKASPALTEQLVALITPGADDGNTPAHMRQAYQARDLEDAAYLPDLVDDALRRQADQGEVDAVAIGFGYTLDQLPLIPSDRGQLQAAYDSLPDSFRGRPQVTFEQDDSDAARAYGCLVEVEGAGYGGTAEFLTDPEFIGDRTRLWIERAAEAAKRKGGQVVTPPSAGELDPGEAADAKEQEKAAKAARDKARDQEHKRRAKVRAANLELGKLTAKAFASPKLDADAARLIVGFADRGVNGSPYAALRYVDERWQDTEVKQAGANKGREIVEYRGATSQEIHEHYADRIAKAKTPEEVFGIFLRGLVVTELADDSVVAQSNRLYVHLDYQQQPAVRKLAEKFKAAPAAIKRRLAAERKEQRDREAGDARMVEMRVLCELDRIERGEELTLEQLATAIGGSRADLNYRVAASWVPAGQLPAVVKRLAKAGEVATRGTGKQLAATITPAGTSALKDAITAASKDGA